MSDLKFEFRNWDIQGVLYLTYLQLLAWTFRFARFLNLQYPYLQAIAALCETRDPNRLQGLVPVLFPGVQLLELDEMMECNAVVSRRGERVPLVNPLKTKEARGCVEKWMMHVRNSLELGAMRW